MNKGTFTINGDSPSTSPTDRRLYDSNALGQVISFTDQNGSVHDYSYDVLGRLTVDYVSTLGSGVNGAVRRIRTTYASGGQVEYLFSDDGAGGNENYIGYAYTGLGDQRWVVHSTRPGHQLNVFYTYSEDWTNNHSRLTRLDYAGGKSISYDYGVTTGLNHRIGRIESIKEGSIKLEEYSYLGLGTIVERNRPQPGVKLSYIAQGSGDVASDSGTADPYVGLDRFGRVVDQRWRKGTTDLDRSVYTYDKSSNRTSKDVLGSGAPTNIDEAYFYDGLDRLTRVNRGTLVSNTISDANAAWYQSFTLDGVGNWSSFNDNGTSQTRTHDRRNRIGSISGLTTPLYDNNGNMTRDEQGRTLTYDGWDRLVSVSGTSGTVTYAYDALGRRISEDYGGGDRRELVYGDGWQVLEELNSGGATQRAYVWGLGYIDALILRDEGTQRLYAQQDANWNVTSLADTSGTVVERFIFTPYGRFEIKTASWGARASSSYNWRYLHQGGRYDGTAGLYHFRHRDYTPALGRWVSPDPLTYIDGMNVVQYVGGSPISLTDPLGLTPNKKDAISLKKLLALIETVEAANPGASPCEVLRQVSNEPWGWSYLHTTNAGWIDLPHFFESAYQTYANYGDDYDVLLAGLVVEVLQWLVGQSPPFFFVPGFGSSGFSYEDLTSNALGAAFGRQVNCTTPLSKQVASFFRNTSPVCNG